VTDTKQVTTPESEANQRITELQARLALLQQELLTMEGRLANRDPKLIERLKKENAEFTTRFQLLKKALFAIIIESYQPRSSDELKLQYETLRKAAVEYCKKTKIDPEIWKSIAS
jgi:hypothetical protein